MACKWLLRWEGLLMLRKKCLLVTVLVIFTAACLLTGCGKSGQEAKEKEAVPQELVIGIGRDFYNF